MSRNGQKLPKDASKGARSRRQLRYSAEEVDELLQPHLLDQESSENWSSGPYLPPDESPGVRIPEEPPVYCQLYSDPSAYSGPDVGVSTFNQPYVCPPPHETQGDASLVHGHSYPNVPGQGTQYEGDFSSCQSFAYAPSQEAASYNPAYNPYFYQDTATPRSQVLPPVATMVPGYYSDPGLKGPVDCPGTFIPDGGRELQPLGSQGQGLLDPTRDITTEQKFIYQEVEGLNRCSGLDAAHTPAAAVPQGGGAALHRQIFGSAASTAQVERDDVPPPTRRRRPREKKKKLYEADPFEDEEEDKRRIRSINQKKYRDDQKKKQQANEAELSNILQEIRTLNLEKEQRGEAVQRLEAEVIRRNLPLPQGLY